MSIEDSLAHPEVRIHEYGDGPNVHKNVALQFGDVEAAFAGADLVREDVFFFEGNTHLPMEQHAAVAHWGADGKLTLWSSTQTPHYVHRLLAKILDVPAAHIRVIAAPVGGGFGGKLDPFAHEIAACKLSQLTGPAGEDRAHARGGLLHPSRPPSGAHVDQDRLHAGQGDITGCHLRTWLDGGAYGSYGVASTFYTGRDQPGDLQDARLQVRGRARLHQQAAVRPQARPRHAAAALRARVPARQGRRAARASIPPTCAGASSPSRSPRPPTT